MPTARCRAAATASRRGRRARQARAAGHLLRARADAILVGRGTVIDDDPLLTCRLPGLEARSPVRIVLARELAGLESPAWRKAHAHSALGVLPGGSPTPAALRAAGAEILPLRLIGGEFWLPAVMEALVARGVTRLLLEGGPATWARILARRADRRGGAVPRARPRRRRAVAGCGVGGAQPLYRHRRLRHLRPANHRQRRYAGGAPPLARACHGQTTRRNATRKASHVHRHRLRHRRGHGARGRPLHHPRALSRAGIGGRRLDGLRRLLPDDDVGARRRRAAASSRSTCPTRRAARRRIGEWQPGRKSISSARCASGRSWAGISSRGTSTAWRASSASSPTGRAAASPSRCPSTSRLTSRRKARCLDGVSLTVNEVERQALRRQRHSAHLDGDHLGAQNPRAIGQPRGRSLRALCRAAPGVSPVTHDAGKHRHLGRPRLPVLDRTRSSRTCATGAWSCSSTPRSARTRAISSFRRRWRRPTPINFMAKLRPRADLPDAHQARAQRARSRIRWCGERACATHGLHAVDRGARRHFDGHLGGTTARARSLPPSTPTKGAADIVSPGHVFPLVAREGGVLIRAGHTEASVDLARLAASSGGRDLRDHERRRHHGAHAGPSPSRSGTA